MGVKRIIGFTLTAPLYLIGALGAALAALCFWVADTFENMITGGKE